MLNVYITNIKKLEDKKAYDAILNDISAFRKEKLDAVNNDEVKLQILAASYLIDEYLKTIGLREKDMVYKLTKNGKPYFENNESIKFSISHRKNLVGVAFSDREVGFDIQQVRNIGSEIYNYVLSDKEKEDVFSAVSEADKLNKFFRYWVIKEAILKRDGTGLKRDMENVFDDFGLLGMPDSLIELSENDIYYYCVNNAFDKRFGIHLI